MKSQWEQICEHLQQVLPSGTYKVWIVPLQAQVGKETLTLVAPSRYMADRASELVGSHIARSAEAVLGRTVTLKFKTKSQKRSTKPLRPPSSRAEQGSLLDMPAPSPSPSTPQPQKQTGTAEQLCFPMPMPARRAPVWRFDFSSFIVGPSNNIAYAAAQNLVHSSGQVNTLFLSAGPGLGKTHLIQAVGRALCEASNLTAPRVEYLTAESFAACFVQAAKSRDFSAFKWRFHEADVLLLEDIHFLQSTDKIQIELLSAIKELQECGKRVILTSSFTPRELKNVDSGLVSRFTSGFLAAISKPDKGTRKKILLEKARQQNFRLPDDVCELLAERLTGDVRQLESCLQNLVLRASLLNAPATQEMALEVLSQYAEQSPFISLESITRQVCEAFNLQVDQLSSRSRKSNLVVARNTIFYLARKYTDLSLESIGKKFSRRHSTVIKGISSLESALSSETSLGRQIASLLERIEKRGS
ncbi:MAG: chromosomal replication initiator protein DnaA [Desulfovibrionaceae bacterium]|nr:chromosomal replication initiator protein DnaA [Desulfovibrionaceae bacterium]